MGSISCHSRFDHAGGAGTDARAHRERRSNGPGFDTGLDTRLDTGLGTGLGAD